MFSAKLILISHSPIWDEFWIFEYMMGQLKKGENIWENEKEECDSRVKTLKRQSREKTRIFSKAHGQSQPKNEKSTIRKHLKPLRSSIPFETGKFEPFIQECLSQTPESITVGLDAYKITIFRNWKWIFLRCLIFKEF